MSKKKYLALLAVAVMFISVLSVMSHPIGGKMYIPDGNKHAVLQTTTPPIIDGNVQVGVTWPVESWIGHTYIANKGGGIPVTDVYMLFDDLTGYNRTDNPPAGYGPEDEVEKMPDIPYYLYIGIEPRGDYEIAVGGQSGSWVVIDWDQDGKIDFDDHNGNSVTRLGYRTAFFQTATGGAEWAIPYIDEFEGICQSPFWITIHIEIVLPDGGGGGTETSTFPDRPPGKFLSTEICVGGGISPEPPEPGDWGIRTIGFWKHQFNTALGFKRGHQHVPTENLLLYLAEISSESTKPVLQDMGTDMIEALAILELRGKHSMYDKTIQQLLAVWLNYVSGNEWTEIELNGTLTNVSLLWVIQQTEWELNHGDPADWEYWKDICDATNNSGDE